MPVIDGGMVLVACFGLIAYSTVAFFAWIRRHSRAHHLTLTGFTQREISPWFATAIAILPLGYLTFAVIEEALWSFDYSTRQYEVIDGCVRGFREVIQTDHDLGVDTFNLNGHSFRLSDSGWRIGYHVSHHHGSPIQEGSHLRVFANGPRLLRIDESPEG